MKKYVNKPDEPTPAYSTFPWNPVFAVKWTESGSRQSSGVQEQSSYGNIIWLKRWDWGLYSKITQFDFYFHHMMLAFFSFKILNKTVANCWQSALISSPTNTSAVSQTFENPPLAMLWNSANPWNSSQPGTVLLFSVQFYNCHLQKKKKWGKTPTIHLAGSPKQSQLQNCFPSLISASHKQQHGI